MNAEKQEKTTQDDIIDLQKHIIDLYTLLIQLQDAVAKLSLAHKTTGAGEK